MKIPRKLYGGLLLLLVAVSIAIVALAKDVTFTRPPSEYPDIVARVGERTIKGAELASLVRIMKNSYERMGQPHDQDFYERTALRKLVSDALIIEEAKTMGIDVSQQEASKYLKDTVQQMTSIDDNNPYKQEFLAEINTLGFSNIADYISDPRVIEATKQLLLKTKLRNTIYRTVSPPSETEIDEYIRENNLGDVKEDPSVREQIKAQVFNQKKEQAWKDYVQKLLATKKYELYIPIDID